jgi:hypothetical protein
MTDQADVRRIALSFPEVDEEQGRFAFGVRDGGKSKAFAWVWLERIAPKKARVPQPAVLAVRVANLDEKDILINAAPAKFFTEPHYNGYPAVLVRLAEVTPDELEALLAHAWRCRAPRALAKSLGPAAGLSRLFGEG